MKNSDANEVAGNLLHVGKTVLKVSSSIPLKSLSYIALGLTVLLVGVLIAFFEGYLVWPGGLDDNKSLLEKAIVEFQRAIELEPDNEQAYRYLAQAYKLAEQPERQASVYQQAIEVNPEAAWPHVGLGKLYLEVDDIEAAIDQFKQAIELEPDNKEAYVQLGQTYLERGEPDTAFDVYQSAIETNPDAAWPYQELGRAYLTIGDKTQALTAIKQAIALEPENASLYTDLGGIYQWHLQNPQEALIYYRRAVALAPENGLYRTFSASALFAFGQKVEGLAKLDEALNVEPDSSAVQQAVGDLLWQNGSLALAQSHYELALKLDSQNTYAYMGLARLYRQQQNYDKAFDYAERVIKLDQDQGSVGAAYAEQGLIYQAQQKTDEALERFFLAMQLLPNNDWLQITVGNIYLWEKGQPEEAIAYHRRATELAPDQPWNHLFLGQALLAVNDQAEGLQEFEKALTLAQTDVNIYLELGRLAGERQAWDQVIRIYEYALAQGVANADVYIQLGDAYQMIGNPEQAMVSYRQAARLSPDHPGLKKRLQDGS